jgi:hypothetical protein
VHEPRVPVVVVVLGAVALYATLPGRFVLGSGVAGEVARWIVPALELALLVPLAAISDAPHEEAPSWRRPAALVLTAVLSAASAGSVSLLVHELLIGSKMDGRTLFRGAVAIWLTNVVAFGLWYWLFDRGGPAARARGSERPPDFAFPQTTAPELAEPGWRPMFVDYLYVAFTNAAAFSPTDTMPLSRWAKLLMAFQSGLSLVTVALVAARAVNILH